jgi:uncharacterized protein YbjT (DUF2867 family)
MDKRKVLLLGATGLVGRHVLDGLLADDTCTHIRTFTRAPVGNVPGTGKLDARVVDFDRSDQWRDQVAVDQVICALGTTIKKAGSRRAFRRVDYDYPLAVAQAARNLGCRHFLLVSAMGANPRSRIFYSRVKGQLEAALLTLEFEGLSLFRPSLLLGHRDEFRPGEAISRVLGRGLGAAIPSVYRPIHARRVAAAMIQVAAQHPAGNRIYTSADIAAMTSV